MRLHEAYMLEDTTMLYILIAFDVVSLSNIQGSLRLLRLYLLVMQKSPGNNIWAPARSCEIVESVEKCNTDPLRSDPQRLKSKCSSLFGHGYT